MSTLTSSVPYMPSLIIMGHPMLWAVNPFRAAVSRWRSAVLRPP